jgi:predicted RNA-binding protein with PIN domain
LRLPFTKNQYTAKIRTAVRKVLDATTLPEEVKMHMYQNLRVVNTKRESVADIFYNHISFSKRFQKENVPKCICSTPFIK